MLRFFRHIRKSLMEQNKIRTYFLYATGEIFLVVIGILIALQVNNWNEWRKDRIQEKNYLERLTLELKSDSLRLEGAISLTNYKIDQANFLLNKIEPDVQISDSSAFVENAFLVGRGGSFMPYLPTYQELVSTGDMGLIQNEEIINHISRYINRVEGFESFVYSEGEQRRSAHNNHIHRYFSALLMDEIWELHSDEEFELINYNGYLVNIDGFRTDSDSAYHIRNVAALNAELNRLYKQLMETYISPILDLLYYKLQTQNE